MIALDPVQRFEDFKEPPQASDVADSQLDLLRGGGSGRYQFWASAVDAFEAEPVHGVGAGGYGPYWLEHREIPIPATRAHSLLFEILAELGIGGLALILGFFAVAAVAGCRRWLGDREWSAPGPALAVLAAGVLASSIDWTWDLPAVFAPTVVAAAILTGPATLRAEHVGAAGVFGTAHSRRRFAAGVCVLLVAWVAICASGLLLLSDSAIRSSAGALERDDVESALSSAENAVDLQPWAAEPRIQQALVYERRRRPRRRARGDRRGRRTLARRLRVAPGAGPARRPRLRSRCRRRRALPAPASSTRAIPISTARIRRSSPSSGRAEDDHHHDRSGSSISGSTGKRSASQR